MPNQRPQQRGQSLQCARMRRREPLKKRVGFGGELDQHLATVIRASPAPDERLRGEPIDQAHGTVMANAESLGESPCGDRRRCAEALDREQRLMLLGRQSRDRRGVLAEDQEPAEHVAELGEALVICLRQSAPCVFSRFLALMLRF
jgi:hypothetical protein